MQHERNHQNMGGRAGRADSSESLAVGRLEGQRRFVQVVPDVVVHLHDVADNRRVAGRALHDPAAHAVFHRPEVVLHLEGHVAAVEVQHHGREHGAGAGRLEADLVPIRARDPREVGWPPATGAPPWRALRKK